MTNFAEEFKNCELSYVAIEGVIGAGKTTLANLMKNELQGELLLEQFEANPFLGSFYKDRERYAFQTQVFFLLNRYQQQTKITQKNLFSSCLVSDYIFEKDKIFAQINLSGEEYKLYETLYSQLEKNIVKPDIVIYLQTDIDKLMHNIRKRNRQIEKNMDQAYIEKLIDAYDHFFFTYKTTPLLIVNSNDMDFLNNKEDLNQLFSLILRKDRAFVEYFSAAPKGLL